MSTLSIQPVTSTNPPITDLYGLPDELFCRVLEFLGLRDHKCTQLIGNRFRTLFPLNAYLGPTRFSSFNAVLSVMYRYKINHSDIHSIGSPVDIGDDDIELIDHPLRSLEICNYTPSLSNEGLEKLASQIHLKSLSLMFTKVTNEGLKYLKKLPLHTLHILSSRKSITGLPDLQASKSCITDEAIPHLLEIPSLTSLSIEFSSITKTGLDELTALPLKKLSIIHGDCTLTNTEEQEIRDKMPSLKTLEIGNWK